MPDHESQDASYRGAMVADIERVFADVTRGRLGYSWSECEALDRYDTAEDCERARLADKDTDWRELVDDARWEPFPGCGGFSFINHEGFRYYLPPAMIRCVNGNVSDWCPEDLLRVIERFTDEALGFWTQEQLACIARFIRFMSMHDEDDESRGAWASALVTRWSRFLSQTAS